MTRLSRDTVLFTGNSITRFQVHLSTKIMYRIYKQIKQNQYLVMFHQMQTERIHGNSHL